MRKLGTDALNHIEHLIAAKDTKTQTSSHSRLNKQEEIDIKKKTPLN